MQNDNVLLWLFFLQAPSGLLDTPPKKDSPGSRGGKTPLLKRTAAAAATPWGVVLKPVQRTAAARRPAEEASPKPPVTRRTEKSAGTAVLQQTGGFIGTNSQSPPLELSDLRQTTTSSSTSPDLSSSVPVTSSDMAMIASLTSSDRNTIAPAVTSSDLSVMASVTSSKKMIPLVTVTSSDFSSPRHLTSPEISLVKPATSPATGGLSEMPQTTAEKSADSKPVGLRLVGMKGPTSLKMEKEVTKET